MWKADGAGERMPVMDSTLGRWGCGCRRSQDYSPWEAGEVRGDGKDSEKRNPYLLLPSILVFIQKLPCSLTFCVLCWRLAQAVALVRQVPYH